MSIKSNLIKQFEQENAQVVANLKSMNKSYVLEQAEARLRKHNPGERTLDEIIQAENLRSWHSDDLNLATVMSLMFPLWNDHMALFGSERNALHQVPANSSWERGYRNFIAKFLRDNAEPVNLFDSTYGWRETRQFLATHPNENVVGIYNITEDAWSEFQDTFSENSQHTGVTAEALYSNGAMRKLRWEGSLTEIMQTALQ